MGLHPYKNDQAPSVPHDEDKKGFFMPCHARAVLLAAAGLLVLAGAVRAEAPAAPQGAYDLRIGSDEYEPFFYRNASGDFIGIDVDLAREACRRIGCRPIFALINWQNRDDYLAMGQVDCLWGGYTMTGREERYDWSGPYFRTRQMAAVRATSHLTSIHDLKGETVAVQSGGRAEALFSAESFASVKPRRILSFASFDHATSAALNGYASAVAGHENAIATFAQHSKVAIRFLMPPLLYADLGVAFAKRTPARFTAKLTETLREMLKDGTVCRVARSYGADGEAAVKGLGECR